jgi:hypothetical protein
VVQPPIITVLTTRCFSEPSCTSHISASFYGIFYPINRMSLDIQEGVSFGFNGETFSLAAWIDTNNDWLIVPA